MSEFLSEPLYSEKINPMIESTVQDALHQSLEAMNLGITSTYSNEATWEFGVGRLVKNDEHPTFVDVSDTEKSALYWKIIDNLLAEDNTVVWDKIITESVMKGEITITIDRSLYPKR